MTETLIQLLLRLSESGEPARLPGILARRHFGPAFEHPLEAGVLEEDSPAETWPTCANCDCGIDARPILEVDGVLVAGCPVDANAATRLDEEDRPMFLVHGSCLVAGADGPAAVLREPLPGLWQLSRRIGGREVFVILRRSTLANPALTTVIRTNSTGQVALLAPQPSATVAVDLRERQIPTVPVSEAIRFGPDHRPLLDEGAILRSIHVGPACLAVWEGEKRVEVDGTPQHVAERPFHLLLLFVQDAV